METTTITTTAELDWVSAVQAILGEGLEDPGDVDYHDHEAELLENLRRMVREWRQIEARERRGRSEMLKIAASMVRAVGPDDAPDDIIYREPIVHLAMRLKGAADANALNNQPSGPGPKAPGANAGNLSGSGTRSDPTGDPASGARGVESPHKELHASRSDTPHVHSQQPDHAGRFSACRLSDTEDTGCELCDGRFARLYVLPGAALACEQCLALLTVRSEHSETEAELRASVAALVRCGDRLRDVAEHPESCSLLEDGPGSCDCDCGLEEAQERWRWVVYEAVERGGKRLLANARNAQENTSGGSSE